MYTEILKESTQEKELKISFADRAKMQRDLMIKMGMDKDTKSKNQWIDIYAKYFEDIELERPDLIAGYCEIDDDQLFQERLNEMQNELEKLVDKIEKKAD